MNEIAKIIIYPEYISFRDFADRFCEEYVEAHLPIVQDENKWVEWAMAVAGNEAFTPFNIPSPASVGAQGTLNAGFKTWQEWAMGVYICLTNNMDTN